MLKIKSLVVLLFSGLLIVTVASAAFATSSVTLTANTLISGGNSGLDDPVGLAIDSNGNIYVSNTSWSSGANIPSVTVYAAGSNGNIAPIRTVTGITSPKGVAVSSTQLFVGDGFQRINVFPLSASGAATPTFQINLPVLPQTLSYDPVTGYLAIGSLNKIYVLTSPQNGSSSNYELTNSALSSNGYISGLAWDSTGGLYASVTAGNKILYFAPGATGAIAPTRTISGNATTLVQPQGLALQPVTNDIFVSSGNMSQIVVFDDQSSGDVAPLAIYTEANPYFFELAFTSCTNLLTSTYDTDKIGGYTLTGCSQSAPSQSPSQQVTAPTQSTVELAQTGFSGSAMLSYFAFAFAFALVTSGFVLMNSRHKRTKSEFD